MSTSTFLLLISHSCLSEKLNQVAPINSVHTGGDMADMQHLWSVWRCGSPWFRATNSFLLIIHSIQTHANPKVDDTS